MDGGTLKALATVLGAIFAALIGAVSKFFWNKIKDHESRHDKAERLLQEIDDKLVRRVNEVENRTTAIESSTVSKDDLFQAITTINEQAAKRDEKIYDKLDDLGRQIDSLRYNQAVHSQPRPERSQDNH